MAGIPELLAYTKEHGGSDLHLASGRKPHIRKHGALQAIKGWPSLSNEDVRQMLKAVAPPGVWPDFERGGDADFAYVMERLGRFRANLFFHENGTGAVFRVVLDEVPTFSSLGLPPVIKSFSDVKTGLILVTGPTGSGKTTTLASILDAINTKHDRHIVTIEEPVEFFHANKKSIISHREIGTDAKDFPSAVRAATREDVDVILVGELREPETVSRTLDAAEMGVLVMASMHTSGAARTIDRIVDLFPAEKRPLVRSVLSQTLVAIVSQLLVPAADGKGRHPAVEIMVKNPAIQACIREGNTPMLDSMILAGGAQGMQCFDDSLIEHVRAGRITREQGRTLAENHKRFDKVLAKTPDNRIQV